MSSSRVIAWCDCGKGHWLVRLALRDGVPGLASRGTEIHHVGKTVIAESSPYADWEPLEWFIGVAETAFPIRCPGGKTYRVDVIPALTGGKSVVTRVRRVGDDAP